MRRSSTGLALNRVRCHLFYAMLKPTLADTIVFALTDDIVGRRLPPGENLDEATLGRRFGVSRTPVREALRQLASSGLVQLRPHRAPIVAPFDEQRIAEMFDVMAELEALCASRACVAMTIKQRSALEQLHQAMGETMRAGDVTSYRACNAEFHTMIYDAAANSYLRELAQSTRVRLAPYRGAQLEAPERMVRSYAEHDAIVTAILRGEGGRVANLMRQHLALTRDALDELRARKSALNIGNCHQLYAVNAAPPASGVGSACFPCSRQAR